MPDTLDYRSVRELLTIPEMYIPSYSLPQEESQNHRFSLSFVIPPEVSIVTVFVDVFFFCTVEFLAVCIIAACAADGVLHILIHTPEK